MSFRDLCVKTIELNSEHADAYSLLGDTLYENEKIVVKGKPLSKDDCLQKAQILRLNQK